MKILGRINTYFLILCVLMCKHYIRLTKKGREAFHDKNDHPFVRDFEDNCPVILEELQYVMKSGVKIPAFQEVSPMQKGITNDDKWKTFVFKGYNADFVQNHSLCPETSTLLDKYPNITSAMFSILEPGKTIPPHTGPFNGVLRFHLPLIVPDDETLSGITIKEDTHHWEQGVGVVFDDSFSHHAWNNSNQVRVVLFIDFIRPLPWPISWLNKQAFKLIKRMFLIDCKEFINSEPTVRRNN